MLDLITATEESLREEATRIGRAVLETALERYSLEQRDAFWNAIGLYYSSRRHPGAGDPTPEAPPVAAVA